MQNILDKLIMNLGHSQPIDKVVTLLNIFFSDEVLKDQISTEKIKLLGTDDFDAYDFTFEAIMIIKQL